MNRAQRFNLKEKRYHTKREENILFSSEKAASRILDARRRSSPRARKTYLTIVPSNEFTQVHPQVDTAPSAQRRAAFLTPPSSREQSSICKGGIFQGYPLLGGEGRIDPVLFVEPPRLLPWQQARTGQTFLMRFHPATTYRATYPRVGFLPSVSRVASAPGRRSSKGRKHGFTSAIRSAPKRPPGRGGRGGGGAGGATGLGGPRRESFERGCGDSRRERAAERGG